MNRPYKILVAEPLRFSSAAQAVLRTVADVDLRACRADELRQAFQAYDVVWFRLAHRVDADVLGASPRCRLLASPVTGLDHIDLEACAERGIRVISLRGEVEFLKEVRATAELAVGLALALMRKIVPAAQSVQQGVWNRDLFQGRELYRKTAAVVGVGRLGEIVAGYFKAFGMRVVGYDPRPDGRVGWIDRAETLDDALRVADLVSLHVPYDRSTRHLIGARELAQMKPGAVLINTSRGGVVDEAALRQALEAGRLAGAGLDVLDGEPNISEDHPLVAYAREHDHVLIVPHIGGNTEESFEKTEVFLANRVVEALGALEAA